MINTTAYVQRWVPVKRREAIPERGKWHHLDDLRGIFFRSFSHDYYMYSTAKFCCKKKRKKEKKKGKEKVSSHCYSILTRQNILLATDYYYYSRSSQPFLSASSQALSTAVTLIPAPPRASTSTYLFPFPFKKGSAVRYSCVKVRLSIIIFHP